MPVAVAPAVDTTIRYPAELLFDDTALVAPLRPPVDPGPGDPDVPPAPDPTPDPPDPDPGSPLPPASPRRLGRRVSLVLAEANTHRPITTLHTGVVDSYDDPFGLEPSTIKASYSEWDPGFAQLTGLRAQTTTHQGRTVHRLEHKRLEWQVWDDGRLAATGVDNRPIGADGGKVEVNARGPESTIEQRVIGGSGTVDRLLGRGNFDSSTPAIALKGWSFEPLLDGYTAGLDTGTVFNGTRSLRVAGGAKVFTPWVAIKGNPLWIVQTNVSTQIRIPDGGGAIVETQVVNSQGVQQYPGWSEQERGNASQDDQEWQHMLSSGRLPVSPGWATFYVRGVVSVLTPPGVPAYIDRVRMTDNFQTGLALPADLAVYPGLIMRDAQTRLSGGPLGMSVNVRSNTGVQRSRLWPHIRTPLVLDTLQQLASMAGGPDLWFTPDWVLQVAKRQGRDRLDLALTDASVLAAKWAEDPAGQIDEVFATTGFGAGLDPATLVRKTLPGASFLGQRRRVMVQTPPELTFRQAEEWLEGQGEYMARRQDQLDATVTYSEGKRYATGDGVLAALTAGATGMWGPVRIGNRTFNPASETCVLRCGTDPVVGL